jgi:hypothetical protein
MEHVKDFYMKDYVGACIEEIHKGVEGRKKSRLEKK